ncbi:hypothetical protein BHE74_00009439, partial [Ensete ventricosum]
MWPFHGRGPSGFSSSSTAEEVTEGLDGSGLTAIVTGAPLYYCYFAYGQSKLANILHTVELSRRLKLWERRIVLVLNVPFFCCSHFRYRWEVGDEKCSSRSGNDMLPGTSPA